MFCVRPACYLLCGLKNWKGKQAQRRTTGRSEKKANKANPLKQFIWSNFTLMTAGSRQTLLFHLVSFTCDFLPSLPSSHLLTDDNAFTDKDTCHPLPHKHAETYSTECNIYAEHCIEYYYSSQQWSNFILRVLQEQEQRELVWRVSTIWGAFLHTSLFFLLFFHL